MLQYCWHRHVVVAAILARKLILCTSVAVAVGAGGEVEPVTNPHAGQSWRHYGREAFVDFVLATGCEGCERMLSMPQPKPGEEALRISSSLFGCADIDVLLPTLHWVYEAARRHLDGPHQLPGLLVDGGANVGRALSRWIAAFGDAFGRRLARNATQAPCIICAGAGATAGGGAAGAAAAPPAVVVVAVEPSDGNFVLLRRHAVEQRWDDEGFLALQAALGDASGEALLAYSEDFAVDEVATLLPLPEDKRPRKRVRVVTLDEVATAAYRSFPGVSFGDRGIFLLKLDIEGMEPSVLRSLSRQQVPVKFLSFEYAGDVWQESLRGVVEGLWKIGYFCFLVTADRLFPVSGPFWDWAYEMPVWSNLFCGLEGDPDLEIIVQLHSGTVGLWPAMPGSYLLGYADGDEKTYPLREAQQRCTDLGKHCGGITCDCPGGGCAGPGTLPPSARKGAGPILGPCTVRQGAGGLRRSPEHEVTFLRDATGGDPFLAYRHVATHRSEIPDWAAAAAATEQAS